MITDRQRQCLLRSTHWDHSFQSIGLVSAATPLCRSRNLPFRGGSPPVLGGHACSFPETVTTATGGDFCHPPQLGKFHRCCTGRKVVEPSKRREHTKDLLEKVFADTVREWPDS
jgi:hypothetical protein